MILAILVISGRYSFDESRNKTQLLICEGIGCIRRGNELLRLGGNEAFYPTYQQLNVSTGMVLNVLK